MYACGYEGSIQSGNPCLTNNRYYQISIEKHYRISKITAFNNDNGGYGNGQFQAFEVTFSPLDSTSGLPNKIYSFGPLDGENPSKRETISFTQEIVGIYAIPNLTSPDYEGFSFLLEDGSYERFG